MDDYLTESQQFRGACLRGLDNGTLTPEDMREILDEAIEERFPSDTRERGGELKRKK